MNGNGFIFLTVQSKVQLKGEKSNQMAQKHHKQIVLKSKRIIIILNIKMGIS